MTEVLDIAHDMAKDLLKVGGINEITMLEIETLCLPPKRHFQPEDIRRIRMANHVSQAVFAVFLGIGKTTVQPVGTGTEETQRLRATSS